jgi:FkbM family methyltransferase
MPAEPTTETRAGRRKPAIEVRDGERLIVSNGMRFPLDPGLLSQKQRRLLRAGRYEEKEFAAVTALARPEDVVIELGAGIGYMSTVAAVKRRVRAVHAFEANPRLIPYIARVHALNGAHQVQVRNAVLGSAAGSAPFYLRQEFPDSSLSADPAGAVSEVIAVETVEVLDVNAVLRDIAPSVLICDIEGAEAELLPAADLASLRCAVVEVHPQWIGRDGVAAVFAAMAKAGLTYYPKTSTRKVVTFRRDW